MGLFSRKKKNTPPPVYKAPAGWKRLAAGGEAAANVPEHWTVEPNEKLIVEDQDREIRAKVTLYQIPKDNDPQLDDVFTGMVQNWRQYFDEVGPIESGRNYRSIRMNTDETMLHMMGLSYALVEDHYIFAYIMFTFYEDSIYQEEKDNFHAMLGSIGPMI